jgi:hypothetical protein
VAMRTLAAALFALSLVACGAGTPNSTTTPAPPVATDPAPDAEDEANEEINEMNEEEAKASINGVDDGNALVEELK